MIQPLSLKAPKEARRAENPEDARYYPGFSDPLPYSLKQG
jgi:hypothetical protein